jgi:chorismate mutase
MQNAWNNILGKSTKTSRLIISGPCSAETAEQVEATTDQLAAINKVDVLRAGIWKPRTRPGNFEGVGEVGLKWIVDAGAKHNLPVAIEVANASHVEKALKAGVDMLWIGARTTVNPFSVQEIADALSGVKNVPVFVKNPINPDLGLWMGAFERLRLAGVEKLAAIHRGFSSYDQTIYRNAPMWEIPIDFKINEPDIPLVCDPSHIAGRRDLLASIAQYAVDLDMNGLMLESHISPDEAWSDAKQQITATELNTLLEGLNNREGSNSSLNSTSELTNFRLQIDKLDEQIIAVFGDRMKVAREIGRLKKEQSLTILQIDRWKEIFDSRIELASKIGLSEEFMRSVLTSVHKESINQQTNVMND